MASTCKLLLLDKHVRVEGDSTFPELLFKALPFAVLRDGAASPLDPSVVTAIEHYPLDQVRVLHCMDWCVFESVDALNLSLGPPGMTFDPSDPLQIATHLISQLGISVVVAAGNKGPALDTLQPLARAPWVIAVGATDADGQLLRTSSRGAPSGAKPTVVADGSIPGIDARFPDPTTSFATPKVTAMVVWLQKCLELLIGDLSDQYEGTWSSRSRRIKLPLTGIVDTGVDLDRVPPMDDFAQSIYRDGNEHIAISRLPAEAEWYERFMHRLDAFVAIDVESGPETLKRCLKLAAAPMPGFADHEVGAGFVSPERVVDFMAAFTPSRFVDALCPDVRHQVPDGTLPQLDASLGAVWPRSKCDALASIYDSTARAFHCKAL